jgi:hypothetical protein
MHRGSFRSTRRRVSAVVAAGLFGAVLTVVGPAPAAHAAITMDKSRQIAAYGFLTTYDCLQFVSGEPAYVTMASCMSMPASYAQLWIWNSATKQISVTLPQGLGGETLCLTAVNPRAVSGVDGRQVWGSVPVPHLQVTHCWAASVWPTADFVFQTWDYVPNQYGLTGVEIRNIGAGQCLHPTVPGFPVDLGTCDTAIGAYEYWRTLEPTWPVGGFVWSDTNHDGVKDVAETGVGGVRVHLLDGDGNPFAPDVSMLTSSNTADGNLGRYQFNEVHIGSYRVQVDLPAGTATTIKDVPGSTEAADSDVDATGRTDLIVIPEPRAWDLQAGPEFTKINAGLVPA